MPASDHSRLLLKLEQLRIQEEAAQERLKRIKSEREEVEKQLEKLDKEEES